MTAGLLLVQELLLRWVFPLPEATHFNRILYSTVVVTEELKEGVQIANRSFVWASDPDGIESVQRLNLYGFRDRTWSVRPDPGRTRVMFVGDSFVEGLAVPEDQTLPRSFERKAAAAGLGLEVMNLGVAAADLHDYFRLMRDGVPLFRPRHLLLLLYANDLPGRPFDRSWLEGGPRPEFSSPIVPRAVAVVGRLLHGKTVPKRWRGAPFPFLGAVPDPGNPWSRPEWVERFAPFVSEPIASAMRAGRFNPHVVNEDLIYREHLVKPCDPGEHLAALQKFLSANEARLFLIYLPSRGQVSDRYGPFQSEYSVTLNVPSLKGERFQQHAAALLRTCAHLKIPFLDLTPSMRSAEDQGTPLYWDYDEHLRPAGTAHVSQTIFTWWQSQS
ncbi:MAG: hypothetical protein V2A76_01180 [Planctomycetota bacterium]